MEKYKGTDSVELWDNADGSQQMLFWNRRNTRIFKCSKQIYGFVGGLCFGDYQVDAVAYRQENNSLSLRIVGSCPDFDFNGSSETKAFFLFDFFNVEDVNIDVAPEYWLSDISIQKASDGKYLFWCNDIAWHRKTIVL